MRSEKIWNFDFFSNFRTPEFSHPPPFGNVRNLKTTPFSDVLCRRPLNTVKPPKTVPPFFPRFFGVAKTRIPCPLYTVPFFFPREARFEVFYGQYYVREVPIKQGPVTDLLRGAWTILHRCSQSATPIFGQILTQLCQII